MTVALAIFALTYLVIALQRIPRLHIGRPAGALLGAVAMVACGVIDFDAAKAAIDLDTLLFLLGMMIVLGYLELSGFFEIVERRVLGWARSARSLLWLLIASAGALSALFMNDTVCLMLAPIVVRATRRARLPPAPFLIALAGAANLGSSCTIVGNPQNALIGVRSGIGFARFAGALWPVAVAGLVVEGLLLIALYRRVFTTEPLARVSDLAAPPEGAAAAAPGAAAPPHAAAAAPQRYLLAATLLCGGGMVVALLLGARPATAAMSAAAAVILAGAARPRHALQRVDWSLLLFFGGLFVVMRAVAQAGLAHAVVAGVAGPLAAGPAALLRIGAAVTLLSQAVSNVPAVMLFLEPLRSAPAAAAERLWLALASFSTLAGNLTIIGSVANVIVFEAARREGVEVRFGEYLRAGAPLTAITLVLAWVWLAAV